MPYPNYLIHYNKNHDPKTGRFAFNPNHITVKKDGNTTLSSYSSEKDVFRTKKGSSLADAAATEVKIKDTNPIMQENYSRIGRSALNLYKKTNDINKAMAYIKQEMGDEPYRSVITNIDLGGGQNYTLYQLDVIGNKDIYTTYGDAVATYLKDYTSREDYLNKFDV